MRNIKEDEAHCPILKRRVLNNSISKGWGILDGFQKCCAKRDPTQKGKENNKFLIIKAEYFKLILKMGWDLKEMSHMVTP